MAIQNVGVETSEVELKDGATKQVVYTSNDANAFPVDVDQTERDGEVARVKVAGGVTKNMGNFQSLRVDVSIDLPCQAKPDSISSTFEFGKKWVSEKINAMIAEAVNNTQ